MSILWSSKVKKLSEGYERKTSLNFLENINCAKHKLCIVNMYLPTNNIADSPFHEKNLLMAKLSRM